MIVKKSNFVSNMKIREAAQKTPIIPLPSIQIKKRDLRKKYSINLRSKYSFQEPDSTQKKSKTKKMRPLFRNRI